MVLRFPVDDCVQRLQLAVGRGDWIEVRARAIWETDSDPEAHYE
jgi:hypothetical protein